MTFLRPELLIDGYKLDHRRQYPFNTTRVYSNFTPRATRIPGQRNVVVFGLRYAIQRYLREEFDEKFFGRPLDDVILAYDRRVRQYLGDEAATGIGVQHIAQLHELGYLPLEIRALEEGTLCPLRVPLLTIENTHNDFFWLTNYLETILSSVLWLPITSATTAYRMRRMLNDWCDATGGDKLATNWQAHDFSFRGMPGPEAAALSGAAHLLSFGGTDSLPALDLIDAYYDGPLCKLPIAGSVPATEHSVMSAGGDADEEWTFLRLLQLYPTGIVSIVSDTWDLWNVVGPRGILSKLTNDVKKRDGKLVVRPDSGDPVKIICGDLEADFGSPQQKGVVECLWDLFGGTVERRSGCRLLDPHIGVIYGDSINHDRANDICIRLAAKKFASTNVVFGIGSYTYQYVTRDTYGLAMKATWASIDGKSCVLYKKPATDDGTKHSARGRLAVMPSMDNTVKLNVIENASYAQETGSLLRRLWCDGKFVHKQTFDDIKFRLWNQEGGVAER